MVNRHSCGKQYGVSCVEDTRLQLAVFGYSCSHFTKASRNIVIASFIFALGPDEVRHEIQCYFSSSTAAATDADVTAASHGTSTIPYS